MKFLPYALCGHRIHSNNAHNNPIVRRAQRSKRNVKAKGDRFGEKAGKRLSRYSDVRALSEDGEFALFLDGLINEFSVFENTVFNVKVFKMLWQKRELIYLGKSLYAQIKASKNLSLGLRGSWLSF